MSSALSPDGATAALYGCCTHDTAPVHVYTDGSAVLLPDHAVCAGAGVVWGLHCSQNASLRVPGLQTNNRSELFAVLAALDRAPTHRSLVVFTDSTYAIHSLCHWAAELAQCGWQCINADLIRACVERLQRRCCPTTFTWLKGHSGNINHDACDRLAFAGTELPAVPPDLPMLPAADVCSHPSMLRPSLSKAFTTLPRLALPHPRAAGLIVSWTDPHAASHRGRSVMRRQQQDNLQILLGCSSDAAFWRIIRDWSDAKRRPLLVPLDALRDVFVQRMNPAPALPTQWNADAYVSTRRLCNALPHRTRVGLTLAAQHLHRPFTDDDIAAGKHHLRSHRADSVPGFDRSAYSDLLAVPNDILRDLCQACIEQVDVPRQWLLTYIVAILKRGKPADKPDSYRVIGLESCFLKFLTLLIEFRFRAWAEDSGFLPASQNGFRRGYRTNNNTFVLRCAIDAARHARRPLYVAFIDLTNAFPSTDHAALWLKLYKLGGGGPLFDFMCSLYIRMQYIIRADGAFSAPFMSGHGILAGDSASPMFWLLFMADLLLPDDPADITLDGVSVCHLEQADDIVLFSTSPVALQRKIDALARWCSINFLLINLQKSVGMVFGPLPRRLPSLQIYGSVLQWVAEYTYVGVTICSTKRNIFLPHYSIKAQKARNLAQVTFALNDMIGSLPAWQGRILYMARVDPHLIHGCDILPDIDAGLLQPLEAIQHMFLRRLLGLSGRSTLVFLFTETGLEPLRYRRLLLLLRFVHYALLLPAGRLVHHAFRCSLQLASDGVPGWASDVLYVLHHLPVPVMACVDDISVPSRLPDLLARVTASMHLYCKAAIDNSPRAMLLHGRTEIVRHGARPSQPVFFFRPYLRVSIPAHRVALTRLVLSDHHLACEALRHRHPHVTRCWRLCRFCWRAVETPEHALLECVHHPSLSLLRRNFLLVLRDFGGSGLYSAISSLHDSISILRRLLRERRILDVLAKFTFDVMEVFEAWPLTLHPSAQVVLPG